MSDSDFTTHELDEFKDEFDSEVGAGCITQPTERNDFVRWKLSKKENGEIFFGLIP
jgi:hypothetical protein